MPTENNIDLDLLQVVAEIRSCVNWAMDNRRRLVLLAVRAKKRRTRKKNVTRIVREYLEVKKHGF